jgi:hypothetical protein
MSGIQLTIVNNVVTSASYTSGSRVCTIPNTVTAIGDRAFFNANYLDGIIFPSPSSVTSIGTSSFQGCTRLTSITFPSSVTSIGAIAFVGCSFLTSITIPSSVTSIGAGAFSLCTGLTSLLLQRTTINSLTTLGSNSFSGTNVGASFLRQIFLDGYSKAVLTTAGFNSSLLNSVCVDGPTANDSILTITNNIIVGISFTNARGLLLIPNTVSSISSSALNSVSSILSNVAFDSNSIMTSIDANTFYNCTSLTSVSIPSSVTNIGTNAFDNCTNLSSFTIASSNIRIYDAFNNCTNLNSIHFASGATKIIQNAFYDCYSLKGISIPSSVTSIGANAFYNCTSLTNITLQRYGDFGKTTLSTNSFQLNTTYGISNSDYSASIATLFSNGYTYNELNSAGFDLSTLNSYYSNNRNTQLCNDAFIDIDSYNNYNITTLDTSIHIMDTTTNTEQTTLTTNNTNNDGTINSVNYFRQFFKLYNDSNLNTHIYTITPKKSIDINYAIFGNCEAGVTQSIFPLVLGSTNYEVSYDVYTGDCGARGQLNYGTITNCSNIVNITNNISGFLQLNYNNKILRTKNAIYGKGVESNISTNWDPSYNNILKQGYDVNDPPDYRITKGLEEIISTPGYTGETYIYALPNFNVSDNNVLVSSYPIYNGNSLKVQTCKGVDAASLGTPGTPTYALIHTKIPYANFKLTPNINLTDANGNTNIFVDTTNNGIVIDLNDIDYNFSPGKKFTIYKTGNKSIILNCEKSKTYNDQVNYPDSYRKAIKYNNINYVFLNMAIQTKITITYTKKTYFSTAFVWIIT